MVKIAVAGGSGPVAREVIDALVATKEHEIIVLSRRVASAEESALEVTWCPVRYDNKVELVEALKGVHTVLSFLQLQTDPEKKAEKSLIDAAISARVKRFAPSEWGSAGLDDMPFWSGKQLVRDYLLKVNVNEKVLEYTLFQPGLFLEYLASPYKTAKHVAPLDTMFDFENRRAAVVDGLDAVLTFTSVRDVAAIVTAAVAYEGEWPVRGGISGNRVTVSQVLEIGEKVRGRPFTIDKVTLADLEAGELKTSWTLKRRHPAFTEEEAVALMKTVLIATLLSSAKGAFDVSDEFNQIVPNHQFIGIEEFLSEAWAGRP